ncbi:MAG: hypothetical protein LBT91_00645 [Bifidobacteriaceae bacterium]|nr:hypothetical protein [Bifidobacteriaceae bacterium]
MLARKKKDYLEYNPELAWIDKSGQSITPIPIQIPTIKNKNNAISEIKDFISEKYAIGEKRVFTLGWFKQNHDTFKKSVEHIIIIQEIDEQLYFIDPQTGMQAEQEIQDEIDCGIVRLNSFKILRIDDKELNSDFTNHIYQSDDKPYNKFLLKLSAFIKEKTYKIPPDATRYL